MSQAFVGQSALITGSTSGIGRAVAEQLVARDAHVRARGPGHDRLPRHVLLNGDQLRAKVDREVLARDINEERPR